MENLKIGVVSGLALTGITSLITTYDVIANNEENKALTDVEREARKTRFITIVVISACMAVAGIILGVAFRKKQFIISSYSLAISGAVGITYSLWYYYNGIDKWAAFGTSLGTFICFLLMGLYIGYKSLKESNGDEEEEDDEYFNKALAEYEDNNK